MRTLNSDEQAKIKYIIESGIKVKQEMKDLSDLCLAGNFVEAEKVIKNYQEIFKLLFIEASPSPCKYLLEKLSLLENNLRLPLHPLSVEYREKIYEVFKNI